MVIESRGNEESEEKKDAQGPDNTEHLEFGFVLSIERETQCRVLNGGGGYCDLTFRKSSLWLVCSGE